MKNKPKYDFIMGHHYDIMLRKDCFAYNFGYTSVEKIPIFLWLSYKQLKQDNLFKNFKVKHHPEAYEEFKESHSKDLTEIIKKAYNLADKLPLGVGEFNLELKCAGFHGASDGYGIGIYTFELNKTRIIEVSFIPSHKKHYEKIKSFKIKENDLKQIGIEYLKFANNSQNNNTNLTIIIPECIYQLKNYNH